MNRRKQKPPKATLANTALPKTAPVTQPFYEHLHELRQRLMFIAISVIGWAGAAYAVQQHLVAALLKPSKGQHFIYTSPGGGIDFLFRICIYSGVVISLPVIVYNVLRFIEPLITKGSRRFIIFGSLASGILAAAGVVFGYVLGLPAALHFLLHQFTTIQIQPLLTIQSYLGFVIVYMVGSAMLFQVPLLLLFINRIKPLKPSKLFHYERWVILAAFVLAGLMNPSPNIVSQLMVAGPFILMYQIGIGLVALVNRPKRSTAKATAARAAQTEETSPETRQQPNLSPQLAASHQSLPKQPAQVPLAVALTDSPTPASKPLRLIDDVQRRFHDRPLDRSPRPRQYLDGFINPSQASNRLPSSS